MQNTRREGRGEQGRGGKGGSVSVLITKKGRKPSLKKCAMPLLYNGSWIDDKNYKTLGLLSCTLVYRVSRRDVIRLSVQESDPMMILFPVVVVKPLQKKAKSHPAVRNWRP
jgi:hypothetical protein